MNIDYLRSLIAVSEQGSISRAAEQLHISQSALSQQIQTLERLFDTQLFERSHKGAILTLSGETVYHYAINIIESFEQLQKALIQVKKQDRTFKILSTSVLHSYALPCTLYHLSEKYPNVHLDIKSVPSRLIEQNILKGFADIGLISGPPTCKDVISKKVYNERYCLVANPNLTIPNTINLQDIYNYPLIMLNSMQKSRKLLDAALTSNGIQVERLNVPYYLDSAESIKMSALQGYGIVFLPYMSIKKELYNKQLKIINIDDFNHSIDYFAIRRQDTNVYDLDINKFLNYIEEILSETVC